MKRKMRKLLQWRIEPVWYLGMTILVLLLLLYPLLRLAGYSVPWYDDYNYGRFARDQMLWDGMTWGNAIKGAWESIRTSWYAWQGTYSSIFFMTLMPAIWGEEYYYLGPVFLILILTFAVSLLLYTVVRVLLRADRIHALAVGFGGAVLALELIHTAKEGIYWYNGGVHYVGMHSFLMILTAITIRIIQREEKQKGWIRKVFRMIVAVILAFVVAGANFVTALQGLLILVSIMVMEAVRRRPETFWILPVLGVYVAGFYLNVSAPGNLRRADSYIGWGMSPGKAIVYSFAEGGKRAWQFTGWMALVILLFLLPILLHMVSRTTFTFPLPGVVSLWSVCLYATGFTPSLYSLGHGGLGRTLNAVKLTWQLLLLLNVIYWCGWIWKKRKGSRKSQMFSWWFYPLIAVMVLLVFHTESNQAGSFSSYGAYYYIHTGEANNFYQEYLERVARLKSDEQTVGLEPYIWKPWFLCMGDLSEDPENESNRSLASWYDKEAVFLLPRE